VRRWLISDENKASEFREGLWNLIYGSPTAAGLLFMRLCERATKELYKKVVRTDPMGMTREQVFNDLETHYTKAITQKSLICYNISREWRSKLAHPEKLHARRGRRSLHDDNVCA
jgi:hypothetical protein